MGDLRPRHLIFEDLSGALARASGPGFLEQAQQAKRVDAVPQSMNDLNDMLSSLASGVQEAHGGLQQRLDDHRKAALDQIEATGGKLALENHLKAQKANWKIIGQKETFLERLKELRSHQELLQHDFSSDVSIADKAVQTLKEQIRDRNASISKVEQQMLGFIQQITTHYDTGSSIARQLGQQLPRIKQELQEYHAAQQELPEPTAGGMSEVELLKQLAAAEEEAAQLEQEAAREAANWDEEEAQYAALQSSLAELQGHVAEMEEACDMAAKQQGAKYSEQLNRQEVLNTVISRLTGVEVTGSDAASVHLTITQAISRSMPGRELQALSSSRGGASQSAAASTPSKDPRVAGADVEVAEHVLTLEFEGPGSAMLRAASLTPAIVEFNGDVRAARAAQEAGGKEAAGALSTLLLDIKGRIRNHCRRQLQLEDAHEAYPVQTTSVSPELLRCALPNKVEVEVEVPIDWPEEPGSRLKLVQLQGPRASQDLVPLLARLQQELEEALLPAGRGSGGVQAEVRRRRLQGCSLRELLNWVYDCVVEEQDNAEKAAS